jgi:uridine phosphorylase
MAPDAILVGDPGRALLLAQELLEKPKMSNHARGLWGYTGPTAMGRSLTIQATGMGGPSAAMVLADLAGLGVSRVVRVGTCAAFGPEARPGELLLTAAALGTAGSAASFGVAEGETIPPDAVLHGRLAAELGDGVRMVTVASLDAMPAAASAAAGAAAADMQTLAVLARSRALGIAAAAVLIVTEAEGSGTIEGEELEALAIQAGRAAAGALSNLQVEG